MNLDEKKKWFEARQKKLDAAFRKMDKQRRDFERDIEKYEELGCRYRALLDERNVPLGAKPPKAIGRPPVWKSELGYEFFLLVESHQRLNKLLGRPKTSLTKTIRGLRERAKATGHYLNDLLFKRYPSDVILRTRYSDSVRPYWESWHNEVLKIEAELADLDAKFKQRRVMTSDEVSELITKS